jgi:hypothetical protein
MSDPVAEAAAQLAEQAEQTQEAGTATVGESNVAAGAAVTPAGSDASANVAGGDLPNAAPAAVESTTEPGSAPSADGANTTSPIAESSVEPLHVRVAAHLEAIFQMVKIDAERAPTEAESHAEHVKTHIGDVLHRISNGMAVAEGELVQKLEALYRML